MAVEINIHKAFSMPRTLLGALGKRKKRENTLGVFSFWWKKESWLFAISFGEKTQAPACKSNISPVGASLFLPSPPFKVTFSIGKWIPNRFLKLYLLPSYSEVFSDSKEKLALLWDSEREEPSLSNK